ncbi:MAG: hypothetical protein J7K69_05375 [Thermotogae bacterium]|nr:hypothetical protein [Thermotogota bacterium]
MKKYWFSIVVVIGVIIVIALLFQYFNYTEVTIRINTSGIFKQEDLKIEINDKEYPIKDWEAFIPRIKKGTYNLSVIFKGKKILEEKKNISKKATELVINLPQPPGVRKLDYSYDKENKILKMKWEVFGDIKVDRFVIFKDGKKVTSVTEKKYSERFGPFESHLYEIRPLFLNDVYGVAYKVEIGPFSEPAHLKGRVIVPFNLGAERIKVEFDGTEIKLNQDYKFDIKNVIPGHYIFQVLIDTQKVFTQASTVVSGENELLIEIPSLPMIGKATATVEINTRKMKLSWDKAENEYYKPFFYKVEDSKGNVYKVKENSIELPWEVSETTYTIIPVFFEGVEGETYVFHKPPAPNLKINLPQKYNKKILKLELPSQADIKYFIKIDEGKWMKLESNELKLSDGEHKLFIKAVDSLNQTCESSYTVFVDSTPPLPPMDLNARYEEGKLEVSWLPSISEDVKKYIVQLSVDASITYEGTNLVVYDLKKLKSIPDTLKIKVLAEDYYGNRSQKFLEVSIPKTPELIEKEIKFLNDGNDVALNLQFSKFNGRVHLYLNGKEIYMTDTSKVEINLKGLNFNREYILSVQVENDIGYSSYRRLLKFKTPLPKPKIIEIRQTGVNEVFIKIKAEGEYVEYHVSTSDFSMILQSREKEKLITLPQPGEYKFSVKTFSYDNQSLESDPTKFYVLPAQSELPNVINKKVVISKEGGPYLVSKNILITKEGELILGKDVELVFSENSTIQVHGKLLLNNLKITLAEDATWQGIKAYDDSYVEIRGLEFSKLSPFIEASNANILIFSSKFNDMKNVVKLFNGSLTIENSKFESVTNPVSAFKSTVKIFSSSLLRYNFAVELKSGNLEIENVTLIDGMCGLDLTDSNGTADNLLFSKNITGLKLKNSRFTLRECTFDSNVKGISSINSVLTAIDSYFKNNLRASELNVSLTEVSKSQEIIFNKTGEVINPPVRFLYDKFENNKIDLYVADGPYPILLKACIGMKKIFDFKTSPFYKDASGTLHRRSRVLFDIPDKIRLKLLDKNLISLPIFKNEIKIFDKNNKELNFEIQRISGSVNKLPSRFKTILLIDLSDSIIDQNGESIEEYERLINEIENHFRNVEIYVFNSNWVRKVDKDWKVRKMEIWGYTPLYDTILTILNSQVVSNEPYGIVILTDGLDSDWQDKENGSINGVQRLVNIVSKRNIPLVMVIYGESNIFRNSLPHVNRDFEILNSDNQLSILDWRRKDLLKEIEKSFGNSYNLEYEITLNDTPANSKIKLQVQKKLPKLTRIIRIPYYPIETNRNYKLDEENVSLEVIKDLLNKSTTVLNLNF